MKTKKIFSLIAALVLTFALVACNSDTNTDQGDTQTQDNAQTQANENNADARQIGVLLFNGTDPYTGTVRQAMEEIDSQDDSISLEIQDSQNDQARQNDQIDALIARNVDGLLIQVVDFGSGRQVIDKVRNAGIPAVFWNRDITEEITEDDLNDVVFYGTLAPQAGEMQGEIAYNHWQEDGDKNNDGVLQYLVLHGGLDNAEAVARTEESVRVFENNGVETQELDMIVANWSESEAKDATDAWIARFGDDIEVIFANNDGMAIGALTALQQAGYNVVTDGQRSENYIPVYGVDATEQAVAKVESGELAGTVRQNNHTMANGVISLMKNKLDGNDWTDNIDLEYAEDGVSVRMDYEKVSE